MSYLVEDGDQALGLRGLGGLVEHHAVGVEGVRGVQKGRERRVRGQVSLSKSRPATLAVSHSRQ